MKNVIKSVFVFLFGLCSVSLLHAQTPALIGRALTENITRQTAVAVLSQHANVAVHSQLEKLFITPFTTSTAISFHPPQFRQSVFKVQDSPTSHHSASAFAIRLNGKVWGVTAAHVFANIQPTPHLVVRTTDGKDIVSPIKHAHAGNKLGSDVAVFEIPEEIKSHLKILEPAENLPKTGKIMEIAGFAHGVPLYLAAEEVLFSGKNRILLHKQALQNLTGMCGSPILDNGKVTGVYVGFSLPEQLQQAAFLDLLGDLKNRTLPPMHFATPIRHVEMITNTLEGKQGLFWMKVFGHLIAPIRVDENIFSIQLIRNDRLSKTIFSHPFMNFDKLEEFFDLQANDILRITVMHPKTPAEPFKVKIYDVNVSTGKIVNFRKE